MIEPKDNELWLKLRSDIYIRDKGICWICNEFVELRDYDLGHLVDRCNGGKDAYDNLAVMHHSCNINKPRHMTLEEAMKWKLTPSYLTRSKPRVLPEPISMLPLHLPPTLPHKQYLKYMNAEDREATKQLIIEFYTNRPELLKDSDKYNSARIRATSQLADTLNLDRSDIRHCLREAGLVKKYPPQITDGTQYRYVLEHLNELLDKYKTVQSSFLYEQPKLMGISHFCMDIMFFLAGMHHKVSKRNYRTIEKRVAKLQLPISHYEVNS